MDSFSTIALTLPRLAQAFVFNACRRKWYYKYFLDLEVDTPVRSEAKSLGSYAHLRAVAKSRDEAIVAYAREFPNAPALNELETDRIEALAQSGLMRVFQSMPFIFEPTIANPDFPFVGHPDAIYVSGNDAYIHEFKTTTSNRMWSHSEDYYAASAQIAAYFHIARAKQIKIHVFGRPMHKMQLGESSAEFITRMVEDIRCDPSKYYRAIELRSKDILFTQHDLLRWSEDFAKSYAIIQRNFRTFPPSVIDRHCRPTPGACTDPFGGICEYFPLCRRDQLIPLRKRDATPQERDNTLITFGERVTVHRPAATHSPGPFANFSTNEKPNFKYVR